MKSSSSLELQPSLTAGYRSWTPSIQFHACSLAFWVLMESTCLSHDQRKVGSTVAPRTRKRPLTLPLLNDVRRKNSAAEQRRRARMCRHRRASPDRRFIRFRIHGNESRGDNITTEKARTRDIETLAPHSTQSDRPLTFFFDRRREAERQSN